jgi:signal peptidase I
MVIAFAVVVAAVLAAAAVAVLRRRMPVVTVRGGSMAPALLDGRRVLVRTGRVVRRGDLAVFRSPDLSLTDEIAWLVKRVVAAAADAVPSDVGAARPDAGSDALVPAGAIVVGGDFVGSSGSKDFGFVPRRSSGSWCGR